MSAISRRTRRPPRKGSTTPPRGDDPRVVRTRAAVVEAARSLFLRNGYVSTTMEDIAALSGLTKRTVYNNYGDKEALFTGIVADMIAYADQYVHALRAEFPAGITAANLRTRLDELGRTMALAIVRPEVVGLRRLLIGEAREFPALAAEYFDRAPGQVIDALDSGFRQLGKIGLLGVADSSRAAAQFAYLVVGETLDRAVLVGTTPPPDEVLDCAREGVRTFLARYEVVRKRRG